MPTISVSQNHNLDQNKVTAILKEKIAAALKENSSGVSNFVEKWVNNDTMEFAFKAMGFTVSGVLKSMQNQISVDTKVPLAAMLVKGKIESRLREEIGKILDEAK